MGSHLPDISRSEFIQRLEQASPEPIGDKPAEAMWRHFQELRRWNARLSLVGPGTAEEIVERHFGEGLAALPLLRASDRTLVDVGSGGGFPGLVLAAARPELSTILVEPRERKWSFLMSCSRQIRRTGLDMSCRVINSRVAAPLPPTLHLPASIDVITSRALSFTPEMIDALLERAPKARFLLWTSKDQSLEFPALRLLQALNLEGSHQRRIVEMEAA